MVEIILVGTAVLCLDHIHLREFREDNCKETRALKVNESTAWVLGHKCLVELFRYTFSANDFDTLSITFKSLEGLVLDKEVEACGEADATEHSQRVVREGDVWIERRADDSVVKVVDASEWVNEFAKAILVQTDSHCVNGEVATILIVLKSSVLYDRLARVTLIALPTSADEFDFKTL
jgi:hypothetical protein